MTTANFVHKIPRVLRFLLIGGLAGTIHLISEVILVENLHLHPLVANIFAFLIAFCVSFTGQRFLTFADSTQTVQQSLPRFFLIAASAFLINQLLFALALFFFPIPYYLALFIVVLTVAAGTFVASKKWAFATR
jgi:putative flippase GtrA